MTFSRRGFINVGGALSASTLLSELFKKLHFEALGAEVPMPTSFILYSHGNGLQRSQLRNSLQGNQLVPTGGLDNLKPFLKNLMVADTLPCSMAQYIHGTGSSTYSCTNRQIGNGDATGGANGITNGPSIDWVIAKAMSAGNIDLAKQNSIALKLPFLRSGGWCNYGTFLGRENKEATDLMWNPQDVWDSLFGGLKTGNPALANPAVVSPEEKLRLDRQRMQSSVLDGVLADIQKNMAKLPSTEKQKLKQYLESIRDIEKSISVMAANPTSGTPEITPLQMCAIPTKTTVKVADTIEQHTPELWEIMCDMASLAISCGIKRQVSLMHSWGCGHLTYKIGDKDYNHHFHDSSNAYDENGPIMASIVNLHASYAARIWKSLSDAKWSGKSVADSAALLWMSDGGGAHHNGADSHCAVVLSGNDIPLKKSAYVQINGSANLAEFHYTLSKIFGSKDSTFGDGTLPVKKEISEIKT